LAISVAVTLGGAGLLWWNAARVSRSPAVTSLGATLIALGAPAVVIAGFGAWLAAKNEHHRRAGTRRV
jgi:hypothetical protein